MKNKKYLIQQFANLLALKKLSTFHSMLIRGVAENNGDLFTKVLVLKAIGEVSFSELSETRFFFAEKVIKFFLINPENVGRNLTNALRVAAMSDLEGLSDPVILKKILGQKGRTNEFFLKKLKLPVGFVFAGGDSILAARTAIKLLIVSLNSASTTATQDVSVAKSNLDQITSDSNPVMEIKNGKQRFESRYGVRPTGTTASVAVQSQKRVG